MTSTPVRNDTFFGTPTKTGAAANSFVFNVSHNSDHNHSIGDIVDGNFVSFSTSDMYCISQLEHHDSFQDHPHHPRIQLEHQVVEEAAEKKDDLVEVGEKDKEMLESLCDKCRTSYCSQSSSSTLTLTELEDREQHSNKSGSVKTLNVEDISTCESAITVETLDGEEDMMEDINELEDDELEDDINIDEEEEHIVIAIEDNEDEEREQMETKDIVPVQHEVVVEINTCDNSGSEV